MTLMCYQPGALEIYCFTYTSAYNPLNNNGLKVFAPDGRCTFNSALRPIQLRGVGRVAITQSIPHGAAGLIKPAVAGMANGNITEWMTNGYYSWVRFWVPTIRIDATNITMLWLYRGIGSDLYYPQCNFPPHPYDAPIIDGSQYD